MCESETCPCRWTTPVPLEFFMDLWEHSFSITDEAKIYTDPDIRARLDELGWDPHQ